MSVLLSVDGGPLPISFNVHQYIYGDAKGLNTDTPSIFKADFIEEQTKLDDLTAFYIAHSIVNRPFLVSRRDDIERDYSAVILLHFLALDSVSKAKTPKYAEPHLRTWKAETATFEEQYNYYSEINFSVIQHFGSILQDKLYDFHNYFGDAGYIRRYWLANVKGQKALIKEFPLIAEGFNILDLELQA